MTSDGADLDDVANRIWFYEFDLPDGRTTKTDVPHDVRKIHTSRRDKLRKIIADKVPDAASCSAVDFASHEGYFSFEMTKHFERVRGLEVRKQSLDASRLLANVMGITNVEFEQVDLQRADFDARWEADFVLVYGLLYHLEDPIHTLRLASRTSRKHILIETQIFPYDVSGRIEDGRYLGQRDVLGVFSLSVDYAERREGGSTDIALVPSLNALLALMRIFGFVRTEVVKPDADDYEQFTRGSRVIVYGSKA